MYGAAFKDETVIKILLNAGTITSLILYQLCILFGTQIVIILITAITERLFNKFQNALFIIVPIIIGIVLVVVGGLTWTLPNTAISFVGVGILFAESAMYYFSVCT